MQQEQTKFLDELTAREHTGLNKLLPNFVSRSDAKADLAALWPEREAQVQQQYNERYQQYEQQVAAESAAWDETEAKRIEWVQKLLAGDLQEMDHTIAEVLTGLQLPFKTHCDYFLHEADTVCLHVDLPEIEDVIPESGWREHGQSAVRCDHVVVGDPSRDELRGVVRRFQGLKNRIFSWTTRILWLEGHLGCLFGAARLFSRNDAPCRRASDLQHHPSGFGGRHC